jgi:hypothetical protein
LSLQSANAQGEKYKGNYDKKSVVHKFQIGQKVWLSDTTSIGKNAKLAPNWIGPYEIVDVNDTNAKLKIKNKLNLLTLLKLNGLLKRLPNVFLKTNHALLRAINVLIKTTLAFFKTNRITLSPGQ